MTLRPSKCDIIRSQGRAFATMGHEKQRFLQNGSLKDFDFRQICFDLVHFMIPIGSGQKCLTYDPAIAKARRGGGRWAWPL